jgi:Fe-S-cluster containining protein
MDWSTNNVWKQKSAEKKKLYSQFLDKARPSDIIKQLPDLHDGVFKNIDCLDCANCCKKLEPGLETNEIEKLAALNQQSIELFREQCIAYDGEALYLQTKPCLFLEDCACRIYEHRPAACAGYPHLHQPDMKFRRSLWENYAICPIVFNVLELLKQDLEFKKELSK